MRAIVAGILAASIYTLAIAILLSMAMPSRGQIEAYMDAARPVAVSMAPVPVVDARLAS
jgi:hypothetical protein